MRPILVQVLARLLKQSTPLLLSTGTTKKSNSDSRDWKYQEPKISIPFTGPTFTRVFCLSCSTLQNQAEAFQMQRLKKNGSKRYLHRLRQKNAKVKIAFGHVPIYPVLDPSVGSKYSAFLGSEQSGKTDALTDILIDGGVSLLAVGHSHAPYPAELVRKRDLKRLKILSMPCAHSPRALYSKTSRSDRGFAVVQTNDTGISSISIKNYSSGNEISYDYFPKTIDVKSSAVIYQKIPKELYR
jgi:hypothetical protein